MKNKYRSPYTLICVLIAPAFLFNLNSTQAASLYQDTVEQTQVSDMEFEKALEQIKEHKDIKVLPHLSVPPFHKRTVLEKSENQAFCTNCHLALPHQKNMRTRTFMNMHSAYIACETCHFRPEKNEPSYRWLSYEGINAGLPVSSRIPSEELSEKKNRSAHQEQFKKPTALAPEPGARIAPFFNNDLVLILKNSTFSQSIKQEWENGDESKKADIKAKLHAALEKEGPACTQCHSRKDPMIDLKILGATPARQKELNNNTLVRFFDRFKKEGERIRIDQLLR